jgi:hypothetical protein
MLSAMSEYAVRATEAQGSDGNLTVQQIRDRHGKTTAEAKELHAEMARTRADNARLAALGNNASLEEHKEATEEDDGFFGWVKSKVKGVVDAHHKAMDDYYNYNDSYRKMSAWERLKWAAQNPVAWMRAGDKIGADDADPTMNFRDNYAETEKRNMRKKFLKQQAADLRSRQQQGQAAKVGSIAGGVAGAAGGGAGGGAGAAAAVGAVVGAAGGVGDSKTAGNADAAHAAVAAAHAGGVEKGVVPTGLSTTEGFERKQEGASDVAEMAGVVGTKLDLVTPESQEANPNFYGSRTAPQKVIGAVAGLAGTASSAMSLMDYGDKLDASRKKGDVAGAFNNTMGTLEASLGVVGGTATMGGPLFDPVASTMAIAQGGAHTLREAGNVVNNQRMVSRMGAKLRGTRQTDDMSDAARMRHRTLEMAQDNARTNRNAAAVGVLEGGIETAAGVAGTLGTKGKIVSLGLTGVNKVVDVAKGQYVAGMKEDSTRATLSQEYNLEKRVNDYYLEHMVEGITKDESRQIVLMSMGYETGGMKEAYQHVVMQRAQTLTDLANRNDSSPESDDARNTLANLMLVPVNGKYSLQAVAERLGMEEYKPWQEQMAEEKNKGGDPFKDGTAAD